MGTYNIFKGVVMRDWGGWLQVLLPVVISMAGLYVTMSNHLTTLEVNQKNILSSQSMIINIVQPLDKKVAVLEVKVDNLEKDKRLED